MKRVAEAGSLWYYKIYHGEIWEKNKANKKLSKEQSVT